MTKDTNNEWKYVKTIRYYQTIWETLEKNNKELIEIFSMMILVVVAQLYIYLHFTYKYI